MINMAPSRAVQDKEILQKYLKHQTKQIEKLNNDLLIERNKCSALSSDLSNARGSIERMESQLKRALEINEERKKDILDALNLVKSKEERVKTECNEKIESLYSQIENLENQRESQIFTINDQAEYIKGLESQIEVLNGQLQQANGKILEQKYKISRRSAESNLDASPVGISVAPRSSNMSFKTDGEGKFCNIIVNIHNSPTNPSTSKQAKFEISSLKKVTKIIAKKQPESNKQIQNRLPASGVSGTSHGAEYSCLCGKSFQSKDFLEHHLKNHDLQERNFECHSCPRRFDNFGHLKRHMKNVHEIRGALEHYVGGCKLCGKLFRNQKKRSKHICSKPESYYPTRDVPMESEDSE